MTLCGFVTACDDSKGVRDLTDFELSQAYSDCVDNKPTAPGKVQACSNLRRECDRRREELKTYICSTR